MFLPSTFPSAPPTFLSPPPPPPASCSPLLAVPETSRSSSAWLLASARMLACSHGWVWDRRPPCCLSADEPCCDEKPAASFINVPVKTETETRLSGEAEVLRVQPCCGSCCLVLEEGKQIGKTKGCPGTASGVNGTDRPTRTSVQSYARAHWSRSN